MQQKNRILLFFTLILLFIFNLNSYAVDSVPLQHLKASILFFNDIHGHLMPFNVKTEKGKEEVGGIARLSSIINKIRRENDRKNIKTIVLIAGDILQGTPMSTVFKGTPDVECFNTIGIDAMTVGNHEFDFGLNNFLALKKKAISIF